MSRPGPNARRVFVSYATRDGIPFSTEVVATLRRAGFEPFLDRWHLQPGATVGPVLVRALHQAFALIVCATPGSTLHSPWVRAEVQTAWQRGLEIVLLIRAGDAPAPWVPARWRFVVQDPVASCPGMRACLTRLERARTIVGSGRFPRQLFIHGGIFSNH